MPITLRKGNGLRALGKVGTGLVGLPLLSINGIYTVGKPPAAQTIKPAHLIDPIHAPTRVLT